ncbi:hypothetical protein F4818DRAFT_423891 [Hypoxylon cercidicola]|nr:hypothetical protein F4818DRAFT_423891 [Hypoxylon cercidicola]
MAPMDVFVIPELLENILIYLPVKNVIVNAQRVSKHWNKVIKVSPKLQQEMFQRAKPIPPDEKGYTNHILTHHWSVREYVLMVFFGISLVRMGEKPFQCRTQGQINDMKEFFMEDDEGRRRWVAPNASWRTMHIAQPPITKVWWKICRKADLDPRYYVDKWVDIAYLPSMAFEFEFPDGLRMGDYFDLILGTRCRRIVTWPTKYNTPRPYVPNDYPNYGFIEWIGMQAWNDERAVAADKDGKLTITQYISHPYCNFVKHTPNDWYLPTDQIDLKKYHVNLRSWEKREYVDHPMVPFKYVTQEIVSTDTAMDVFIQAARTILPFPPSDPYM